MIFEENLADKHKMTGPQMAEERPVGLCYFCLEFSSALAHKHSAYKLSEDNL